MPTTSQVVMAALESSLGMFQPLGRRRKEYLHQRNGIPRRSTSSEQSRCSTSRGKIFFAILAKRLTSFLTGNSYIVTSVQKGGVPGFSGCVEHTSAITQLYSKRIHSANGILRSFSLSHKCLFKTYKNAFKWNASN